MTYRKNQNKPKWGLINFNSLLPLVRVMEFGEIKYPGSKWKTEKLSKDEILESAFRHLAALMDGEELDKESGLNHIAHLMANCMFYSHHYINKKE